MPWSPTRVLKVVALPATLVFLVYLLQKLLSPFMAAALLAIILEPLVGLVEARGISRKKSAAIVLLVLIVTSNLLIFVICTRLVKEIVELIRIMPRYREILSPFLKETSNLLDKLFSDLPVEYSRVLGAGIEEYTGRVVKLLISLNNQIINGIVAIPRVIIWLMVLFISLYFMLVDKEKILNCIYEHLPGDMSNFLREEYIAVKVKSLGIIKAYFIICTFIGMQTAIGLYILGVDYALIIGMVVGLLDLIPFIGPGFVFIPWIVVELVKAEFFRAFSIAVMYIMLIISREILEAKMISRRLGLHPLISMVAMYLGYKAMGIMGLIIGPLVFLTVKEFLGLDFLKCH